LFLGEHEHTIDEKNRLTLPARFRAAFAGGLVLTRGMERCLNAYPKDDWQRLADSRIAPLDPFSRDGRKLQRFYLAGASEAEPDRQGRIMVPAPLLQHAGLEREIVVVGVYDRLEIWNRDAWQEHLREIEGSAEDVAESLATKRD